MFPLTPRRLLLRFRQRQSKARHRAPRLRRELFRIGAKISTTSFHGRSDAIGRPSTVISSKKSTKTIADEEGSWLPEGALRASFSWVASTLIEEGAAVRGGVRGRVAVEGDAGLVGSLFACAFKRKLRKEHMSKYYLGRRGGSSDDRLT